MATTGPNTPPYNNNKAKHLSYNNNVATIIVHTTTYIRGYTFVIAYRQPHGKDIITFPYHSYIITITTSRYSHHGPRRSRIHHLQGNRGNTLPSPPPYSTVRCRDPRHHSNY